LNCASGAAPQRGVEAPDWAQYLYKKKLRVYMRILRQVPLHNKDSRHQTGHHPCFLNIYFKFIFLIYLNCAGGVPQ
jgi:hypothetical protein